ncbi:ANTAR domain-containing protein [Motilibacter aurantiacus]|uniref:ANTAR domain-containing protein n=1 Tax=Motilibacter aurantiacus TaxID=2714955 RepID=UPI00140940C3|nr:ANTAR domain-containing protein [Motilibacter aurantiacus]NHC46331.1 ANTAR domain-containing protein [Motilibacter aurantiacus]
MNAGGDLRAWQERLDLLEAELIARAAQAADAGDWTPRELAALADELDELADQRDRLADAKDTAALRRDEAAEAREGTATGRDRAARERGQDTDEGFPDRFLSARDRDEALSDRVESHAERRSAQEDRHRSAAARARAAGDRDAADRAATASAAELSGLRDALASRHVIGLAQGILMERHGLDADQAFRMLVELSSHTNTKLRDVAAQLAHHPQRRPAPRASGAGAVRPG